MGSFGHGIRQVAASLLPLVAVASLPVPGACQGTATVTALKGEALAAGAEVRSLSLHGKIRPSEAIHTGSDTALSVLVGSDLVVDLCGDSRLSFEASGNVAMLDSGNGRVIAGPRRSGMSLELVTPAAIAELLGTDVQTIIDPATGATTVISRDHPVRVRSASPGVAGETTVCCGEAVEVEKGKAPGPARKLDDRHLSELGRCFLQLHEYAAAADLETADRLALMRLAGDEPLSPLRVPSWQGLPPMQPWEGACDLPGCAAGVPEQLPSVGRPPPPPPPPPGPIP